MRSIQRNAACVAAISILLAVVSLFVRPAMILGRVVERFDAIPMSVNGWNGRDVDPGIAPQLLPNSSVLTRDYHNAEGESANLTIVCGLDIADIHSPEYCFAGQGWGRLATRTILLRQASDVVHPVRLLLLNDAGSGHYVCVYWYAGPDGSKDTLSSQRFESWRSAFLTGRVRPSALVRILVRVSGDQQAAEKAALSLASYMDNPIQEMVSREPRTVDARRAIGE
jgi:EpsI family protein